MEIPALPRGMDSRIRQIEELVIRLEGKSEFHYDNSESLILITRIWSANVRHVHPFTHP